MHLHTAVSPGGFRWQLTGVVITTSTVCCDGVRGGAAALKGESGKISRSCWILFIYLVDFLCDKNVF